MPLKGCNIIHYRTTEWPRHSMTDEERHHEFQFFMNIVKVILRESLTTHQHPPSYLSVDEDDVIYSSDDVPENDLEVPGILSTVIVWESTHTAISPSCPIELQLNETGRRHSDPKECAIHLNDREDIVIDIDIDDNMHSPDDSAFNSNNCHSFELQWHMSSYYMSRAVAQYVRDSDGMVHI